MTIPTVALDETSPAGSQAISLGDNRIREFKTQVREIMGVDHKYESSGQDADMGKHNQISLLEQADLGTGAVGKTLLGSQTVSGKGELVYTDEDDNDIQITSGGVLLAGTLPNDTYFTAIDNAGTGTVDLIKANTSDALVLADGAVMASDAAPTTDPMIANKKYVDDQISAITESTTLQVTGTDNITSAGTTYDPMDDMELTLTGAGTYIFTFDATITFPITGFVSAFIALDINGSNVIEREYGGASSGGDQAIGAQAVSIHWIATITTETTAKIQWKHATAAVTQEGTVSTRVFTFQKIA